MNTFYTLCFLSIFFAASECMSIYYPVDIPFDHRPLTFDHGPFDEDKSGSYTGVMDATPEVQDIANQVYKDVKEKYSTTMYKAIEYQYAIHGVGGGNYRIKLKLKDGFYVTVLVRTYPYDGMVELIEFVSEYSAKPVMPGSYGVMKEATGKTQRVATQFKGDVESRVGVSLGEMFKAVGYQIQVISKGENCKIKVQIARNAYIMLIVHKDLNENMRFVDVTYR